MKQLLKRGFHGLYVSAFVLAATVQMEGGQAFAATTATTTANQVLSNTKNSVLGGNTSSTTNVFSFIGNLITDIVTVAGAVAFAYTLLELYKGVIGFMRGGANAQRREEAKTHLLHVAVGAVLIGGSGAVLALLYGLFKTLG